uniref:Protein smg-9 n=1 Tax=Aceria tosichella TaxID=561515 RepID=A0A6G1S716_9ACAR
MRSSSSTSAINPSAAPIKVLNKNDRTPKRTQNQDDDTTEQQQSRLDHQTDLVRVLTDLDVFHLKPEREARRFRLIDERDWNIISSEPPNESVYFTEGHSALSIVSVIGPMGVGKSNLLNVLAGRKIFETHTSQPKADGSMMIGRHLTRGVDIYSTYHRILLDCQPFLASSVLEDFLTNRSNSQFKRNSLISDPSTSCHMISLQLATFLIATSDNVIIMFRRLADVHFLKLLASAIMLIGEDNLRAKFIIFSKDKNVHNDNFKLMIERCLGSNRVDKIISDEWELYASIAPYSSEKLGLYHKDPSTFTGKNWLTTCQKLWNSTIKGSSMFSDYAHQVYNSNNCTL